MLKVRNILFFFILMYLAGGIYLYIFQRDFIYFIQTEIKHDALVQNIKINNENIKIIVINPNKNKAILYLPGRSETVSNRIDAFKNNFPEHTVYLVNYRGYGGSSGSPSEKNLFNDAKFIYKKIQKEHKNIILIGRSLGTGIAAYLGEKFSFSKIILVTPYDSIMGMAKDKYPFYPISFILKDHYNSLKRVKNIRSKTLVLLASKDETIEAKYSNNLIKAFNPKILTVKTIKDSGHNSIIKKEDYFKEMRLFLAQ
ncbi:MAG: alpha/beta fold hydrolase [Campylobacteraceae bacterium]|nr:alpha/beta fold hydrolase [Campylobacteraceae bacterium]